MNRKRYRSAIQISVQLQADPAVFDHVVKVMAYVQRSGIGKLSFVTLHQQGQ